MRLSHHHRFIRSSRVLSQPSEGDVPGVPKESPLYLVSLDV